ncbi:hypothetical protein ABMA28_015634 [Loxostege sticticalis]|uniref:Uncharacterized protein n=1 Tax=Loxostege sticticalis TaxID=481309 RepID=A0ABD0TAG9_LOXSC
MLRLLVCVLACWMALSTARPADPTPTAANIIPPIGSTPFPLPTPFLPGGINNPLNPYYNQYKYNPTTGPAIPILTYSNEHRPDGSYSFSFSTADGKQAQEAGYLKDAYIDNNGEPQGTQVVQGSYAYISPEGTPIQVTYVADENGFRPSGVHIPADGKALPPLPAIADAKNRSIFDPEYNRYNPYYNNRFGAFNRPYDPRYPYDPRQQLDGRYNPQLDGRFNPQLDGRYNPYYNRYNPFRPAIPQSEPAKEEAKQE